MKEEMPELAATSATTTAAETNGNLISTLKYWMSKRMDLLNSSQPSEGANGTKPNTSLSADKASDHRVLAQNYQSLSSSTTDNFSSTFSDSNTSRTEQRQ